MRPAPPCRLFKRKADMLVALAGVQSKSGASRMVGLLGIEVFVLLVLTTVIMAFETGATIANPIGEKMMLEIRKYP
ncbi:hypothetical protein BTVI_74653 [Pitangus sulphuratus]|nr:hypothetical protein BTVI_74653 [Pitangus sulphuratus]